MTEPEYDPMGLLAMLEARRSEAAQAMALYRLIQSGNPRPHPQVEYRCDFQRERDRGCLLMRVYAIPDRDAILYSPRYHYSQDEIARQDLDRDSFPERAYLLDQVDDLDGRLPVFAQVACDHRILTVHPRVIRADLAKAMTSRAACRRFLPDGEAEASILR